MTLDWNYLDFTWDYWLPTYKQQQQQQQQQQQ